MHRGWPCKRSSLHSEELPRTTGHAAAAAAALLPSLGVHCPQLHRAHSGVSVSSLPGMPPRGGRLRGVKPVSRLPFSLRPLVCVRDAGRPCKRCQNRFSASVLPIDPFAPPCIGRGPSRRLTWVRAGAGSHHPCLGSCQVGGFRFARGSPPQGRA